MKKKYYGDGKSTWSIQSTPIEHQITHPSAPIEHQITTHLSTLAERALQPMAVVEDRVGLARAYAAPDSVVTIGDTIYVGGTQISRWGENFRDILDDVKIPFHGTRSTYRYAQLQKALAAHPGQIKHLVGHSLGGSVILEAAKGTNLTTTTYGAPATDLLEKTLLEKAPMRFANRGDPVSSMDNKAQIGFNGLGNPHSYSNFDHTSAGNSQPGYENKDGSVTLFE